MDTLSVRDMLEALIAGELQTSLTGCTSHRAPSITSSASSTRSWASGAVETFDPRSEG